MKRHNDPSLTVIQRNERATKAPSRGLRHVEFLPTWSVTQIIWWLVNENEVVVRKCHPYLRSSTECAWRISP